MQAVICAVVLILSKSTPRVGIGPSPVVVGDFNGDGIPDLVTANNDGIVSILLGNGDGTFTANPSPKVGNGPQRVAVGDFNGDGTIHLLTQVNQAADHLINSL